MLAEVKPATNDPLIGRKVGGYAITRRVGQGGMGVVYEARHAMMDKRAAVKVLHRELSADQKLLQRFLNEAKASSAAHHSSIVSIFEYGQLEDGTAFIMMEFLDGETLLTRVENAVSTGNLLPLRLVVELSRQLAAALATIHGKGIIHRDLKPENIFIVPDPVAPLGERVKLLDFGIAKVLDGKARKTTVGMILGTPLYMSPEQCEGSEDLDDKVDVYALGVLIYEMVCGHLPFTADTAAALMRQHMFKDPPPLDQQVLDLPIDLCTLVHKMLAKSPAARPSMLQVGELLEALLPHLGVQASGQHAIIPGPSTGRRRQIAVGGDSSPDPFASTMGGAPVRVSSSGMAMTMAGPADSKDGDRDSQVSVRDSKDSLLDSKDRLLDSKDRLLDSKDGDLQIEVISGPQPVNVLPAMAASRGRLPAVLGGVLVLALGIGILTLRGKPITPPAGSKDRATLTMPTPPPPPPPVPPPPPDKPEPSTKQAADLPAGPAKAETDGEENLDERAGTNKGKGKKSRSRPGKKLRAEEIESVIGKKSPPHTGHAPTDGEADVWR